MTTVMDEKGQIDKKNSIKNSHKGLGLSVGLQ